MQIDKLYPTVGTGDIETTAGITSIEDDRVKTDFFDPYLMGYLTPENAPINICPIKYTLGDSLDISPVSSNIGWGYLIGGDEKYYGKTIYRTDGNEITQYTNSTSGDRYLINSVEMARVCLSGNINIVIATRFIMDDHYTQGVGISELVHGGQEAGNIQEVSANFTISNFLSMYRNGGTFLNTTVRDTSPVSPVYNIDFPLNIDFNDMPKDGTNTLYIPFPEHECTVAIQIIGYTISSTTSITDNGVTSPANIKPFAAYSFDDNKIAIIPGQYERNVLRFEFDTSTLQFANLSSYSDNTVSATPMDDIDGYLMGAFDVQFTSALFANADNSHNFIFGNKYYCDSASNATTMVFRLTSVLGIDDIYKYLLLFHKNSTTPSDTYSTDDTVSIFTSNDTPTMDTMSGTLTEIVSRLRPWQMPNVDITSNEFTPEDIPPEPGPEPGGEPDEGDRGVSIPLIGNRPFTTDFLHQAAFPHETIQSLATQLWDQPDTFWQKIVASTSQNPMNYFISLRYYPLKFTHGQGNNVLNLGRGGELNLGSNYYPLEPVESFNFGTIAIKRQYNNFLDYAPYTRISIFLPYAGTFELNPTIVMGRILKLWLDVDCTDGSGVWTVYNQTDSQPVLIKQCRLAAEVPLSGIDASQMAANIINASLQTAQHTLSAAKTDLNSRVGAAGQALSGNMEGALSGAVGSVFNGPQAVLTGLGDAYNLAQASKEIPQYSGGSTGAAACSANNTPYIVYRRPLCTNPANFAHAVGYLSNKTAAILTLSGFTICRNVDVSGISQATDKEKAQIKQILESGFYA